MWFLRFADKCQHFLAKIHQIRPKNEGNKKWGRILISQVYKNVEMHFSPLSTLCRSAADCLHTMYCNALVVLIDKRSKSLTIFSSPSSLWLSSSSSSLSSPSSPSSSSSSLPGAEAVAVPLLSSSWQEQSWNPASGSSQWTVDPEEDHHHVDNQSEDHRVDNQSEQGDDQKDQDDQDDNRNPDPMCQLILVMHSDIVFIAKPFCKINFYQIMTTISTWSTLISLSARLMPSCTSGHNSFSSFSTSLVSRGVGGTALYCWK